MGLDMYLRAEKYVSGYEFYGEEKVQAFNKLVEAADAKDVFDPNTPTATVTFTVAYWRKANHIHHWFVENVQDGEDECRAHWVSREKLTELRDLCKEILAKGTVPQKVTVQALTSDGRVEEKEEGAKGLSPEGIALAEERLPTQSGFFFGGTEYDHWYVEDLENTVEQIDRALAIGEEWDLEYQSSW